MGNVIAFESPAGAARRSARMAAPADGAQILFFTGVRYVPMETNLEASVPPRTDGGINAGGKRRRRAR